MFGSDTTEHEPLNDYLTQAAPFGATMEAIGYILMASGGPYPLFAFAYVINGFGLGLQVSLAFSTP